MSGVAGTIDAVSKQDGSGRIVSAPDADDTGATILHADLDAFFASVELLERPELRGKPVIVGHDSPRSVVTAATYEARRFGVNSAMPMAVAMRRCPQAVILEPHFERYRHYSREFFDICRTITPRVESVGLDEGFLDVSGAAKAIGSPKRAAELLRERVHAQTGLVVSVGVAGSKFVAKLASSRSKPDGLLVVPVAETRSFLHALPVAGLWGVGPKTEGRLIARGIRTIGDVATTPPAVLRRVIGEAGAERFIALANGVDPRPVVSERAEKSIGHEMTFGHDIDSVDELKRTLLQLSGDVARRLRSADMLGRTISVKLRWRDFTTISRSRTLPAPTDVAREIYANAAALLDALAPLPSPVRLLGVRAEDLSARETTSQTLWDDDGDWRAAEAVVDEARSRFGKAALRPASLIRPTGPERWSGR